jgi:hypothetical protein
MRGEDWFGLLTNCEVRTYSEVRTPQYGLRSEGRFGLLTNCGVRTYSEVRTHSEVRALAAFPVWSSSADRSTPAVRT